MLIHYKQYYTTDTDRIHGLFDRWLARDAVYGIELRASGGRSKLGHAHKYFIFAPETHISHWGDYKEWRAIIRAWSDQEAIELANKHPKVEKWSKQIFAMEFNRLIGD